MLNYQRVNKQKNHMHVLTNIPPALNPNHTEHRPTHHLFVVVDDRSVLCDNLRQKDAGDRVTYKVVSCVPQADVNVGL